MITQILLHTPAYVWALLAALLALGLWQRQARRVRRTQVLAAPLALMAFGLTGLLAGRAAAPLVAVPWLVGLVGCLALGRRWLVPRGARWLADEGRLSLPGSWTPLALIVAIFALRYAAGVAQALHPAWQTAASMQVPLALLSGALSGLFLGRAMGLLALAQTTIGRHATFARS
jgi:hypothetical protein